MKHKQSDELRKPNNVKDDNYKLAIDKFIRK